MYTWWIKNNGVREITAEEWEDVGITGPTTIWSPVNNWSVDENALTEEQINYLSYLDGFVTGQLNSFRPITNPMGGQPPTGVEVSGPIYYMKMREIYEEIIDFGLDPVSISQQVSEELAEALSELNFSTQLTTAHSLSGHRVITVNDAGLAIYADCLNPDHIQRPMWLSLGAWASGVVATLFPQGNVVEPSWNWTPGEPVWLGANGVLTQTIPAEAIFARRVGQVVAPTAIDFAVGEPIVVAS